MGGGWRGRGGRGEADPQNPRHVGAPFDGVVAIKVSVGDKVAAGDPIGTIEAMKMESTITAPRAGTVAALPLGSQADAHGGDLIVRWADPRGSA